MQLFYKSMELCDVGLHTTIKQEIPDEQSNANYENALKRTQDYSNNVEEGYYDNVNFIKCETVYYECSTNMENHDATIKQEISDEQSNANSDDAQEDSRDQRDNVVGLDTNSVQCVPDVIVIKCEAIAYDENKPGLENASNHEIYIKSEHDYEEDTETSDLDFKKTSKDNRKFIDESSSNRARKAGKFGRSLKVQTLEQPLKCEQCEYSTTKKYHLLKHSRTHSGEKPFKCEQCEYTTAQKCHLVEHSRIHSGEKPFKCFQCDFSTAHKSSLNIHVRLHLPVKPFKCSECEYSAINKASLVFHKKKHSGEAPFKCSYCDYMSLQNSALTVHLRIHSGDKPFKCLQCDYSASRKLHLTDHLRTHSGEKPFKCTLCDYSSARKPELKTQKRHITVVNFSNVQNAIIPQLKIQIWCVILKLTLEEKLFEYTAIRKYDVKECVQLQIYLPLDWGR